MNTEHTLSTAWNTGRLYTASGQRIAALYQKGMIYFYDIDRGIWGNFPTAQAPDDKWALQHLTMAAYDTGAIVYTCPHELQRELYQLAEKV